METYKKLTIGGLAIIVLGFATIFLGIPGFYTPILFVIGFAIAYIFGTWWRAKEKVEAEDRKISKKNKNWQIPLL